VVKNNGAVSPAHKMKRGVVMLKNKLYQAFKKITSGVLDSRPALQCLHLDPDMSMTATDS